MARLRQAGIPVEVIAADMKIGIARVERFIEQEEDRRDLAQFECDEVPVGRVRGLFEAGRDRDPDLSLTELARRAGFQNPVQVSRLLGYQPTSASTTNGKRYPGRRLETISVEYASRIVRALGYAPADIQDL